MTDAIINRFMTCQYTCCFSLTIYYQHVMYGAQKERVDLLKDQLLIVSCCAHSQFICLHSAHSPLCDVTAGGQGQTNAGGQTEQTAE